MIAQGATTSDTIDLLRQQHRDVLARLDDLEASTLEPGPVTDFRAFLLGDLEDHLALEEGALFPVLERHPPLASGPLVVMAAEHAELRTLSAELGRALLGQDEKLAADVARAVIALLRAHIDKEDRVLFPLAGRMLSASEHAEVDARAAPGRRGG